MKISLEHRLLRVRGDGLILAEEGAFEVKNVELLATANALKAALRGIYLAHSIPGP